MEVAHAAKAAGMGALLIGDNHAVLRCPRTASGRSAVSRRFVQGTHKALDELIHRDLTGVEVAVLMVDGVEFAGETCMAAMVITADGTKIPVGLRHGDTENGTLVTALLADLVARGLDFSGGLLVIIDGAKALASAVKKVFGARAFLGRCQLHYVEAWLCRGSWWRPVRGRVSG